MRGAKLLSDLQLTLAIIPLLTSIWAGQAAAVLIDCHPSSFLALMAAQATAEQVSTLQGMCLRRGGHRMRQHPLLQRPLLRQRLSALRQPRRPPTGGARAGHALQKRPPAACLLPMTHLGQTGEPRHPLPAAALAPGNEQPHLYCLTADSCRPTYPPLLTS